MKIKYNFNYITVIIFIIGLLSCQCYQMLDTNKKVTFLSRDVGGNNGWNTYGDNLVMDKDSAQILPLREYINIAKRYKDTCRADLPISRISFYGITSCSTPIYPGSENMRDYEIVDIIFSDMLGKNTGDSLNAIILWKNSQYWKNYTVNEIEIYNNGKLDSVNNTQNVIKAIFDSLQHSGLTIK